MIKVKSVYDKVTDDDGKRILVDLFWPEGLKTLEAKVDDWIVELGPSYDLQRFQFDVENWENYASLFAEEILKNKDKKNKLQSLSQKAQNETITLVYGNKDGSHNHAKVLKELIDGFDSENA